MMTKHTQEPSHEMVHHAKAMMIRGLSEQFIDSVMLSQFQGKKGLNACTKAMKIARLELAAPELLAALIAMHSCHRAFSNSENWTVFDDEVRLLAEKAINKAKGE